MMDGVVLHKMIVVNLIFWWQGFKDLAVEPRYKFFTDGSRNLIILGVSQCRTDEEGDYRIELSNEHGDVEYEFKFFVTVEGGMDFRYFTHTYMSYSNQTPVNDIKGKVAKVGTIEYIKQKIIPTSLTNTT